MDDDIRSIFRADGTVRATSPGTVALPWQGKKRQETRRKAYARSPKEDISACLNCKSPDCHGICAQVKSVPKAKGTKERSNVG